MRQYPIPLLPASAKVYSTKLALYFKQPATSSIDAMGVTARYLYGSDRLGVKYGANNNWSN